MNRIARTFPNVEALLEGRESQSAIEALLLHRAGLIHILRRALTELHEHRRVIAGTPGEADVVHRIRYWDDVLGWVKDLRGPDIILMNRRTVSVRDGVQCAVSSGGGSRTANESGRETPPQSRVRAGSKPTQRSRMFRRKGYSLHGLRFLDVQRAFAEAEQLLGKTWQLKGRGHCRRVSLDGRYSPHAAKGAACSWAWVTLRGSMSPRRVLPLAIVKKAAKILGIPARLLISREF